MILFIKIIFLLTIVIERDNIKIRVLENFNKIIEK